MQRRRGARASGALARGVVGAAVALVAAAWAWAAPTFRGDADVRLGDKIHAAFPDPAAGPHRYSFFATAGTTLYAALTLDGTATFPPSLALTHPGGLRVPLDGKLHVKARGARIQGFTVNVSGVYVFEVAAKRGSGGYTLATRAQFGRRQLGLFPNAPHGDESFGFDAPAGARVSVLVAPARRGPQIEITGVTLPDGSTLPVLSVQRGAAAQINDVPLPQDGRSRVTWTNHGAAGDLKLTFRFDPPATAPGVREFGVSDGIASATIERGDPVLAAREGYVGSATCGRCHDELVRDWSDTAHNSAVRSWNRAGLAGAAIANESDFRNGLDLATTQAFAAYGANAPRLLYVNGASAPYQVRIGGATFAVDRVMGGNGLWRERFLTRVGKSYLVLPFEFDERTRTYAAFDASDWYDAANAPRAAVASDRSFEAQCSGCHATGETFGVDASSGAFVTGYVEMNVGCEQCHGPGAEHAKNGDVRKIKNPRHLVDGTNGAADPKAADAVCGRCHTKGLSVDALPGSTTKTEFPFRRDRGTSQAGDVVADFLDGTTDPADVWGAKTNPIPAIPGDTSVAARTDRQHGNDIAMGEHAPDAADAPACFDCHDLHRRVNSHQVATSVNRGVRVATKQDDNSLCLACHAGDEKFPGTSVADAALIRGNNAPASIATAVLDHMRDIGMPVRAGLYDPVGTGVGRCTTCHMPKTAGVGPRAADKGGFAAGDLSSHRFEIVWPRASALYGTTNSCSTCHPTDPQDVVGPILTQWANPTPGKTYFHGRTPPASRDGVALNGRVNPTREGGVLCIQCHAAEGFTRIAVNPDHEDALPQDEIDVIAKESLAQDRGLSCDACHGRRADGLIHGEDRNPLRVPKTELCGTCHNAETVTFADFRDHGAVLHHPQKEMLAGTAGDSAPGIPASATTSHSGFPDGCVTCHFDTDGGVASHDFRPNIATCANCHKGLATFDRPAKADYDGDGVVRGIQTEVSGLLDRLKAALLLDARMSFANGLFDFGGASDHALTGASDAQKRAVFNWYAVSGDGSRGVHDAARAVQLLQASYRELTGSNVPGAALR